MADLKRIDSESGLVELWVDNLDGTFSRKVSAEVVVGDIQIGDEFEKWYNGNGTPDIEAITMQKLAVKLA